MCGLCGIVRFRSDAPPLALDELRATSAVLAPRGPDGQGEWCDPAGRVAFGHRRLAVIDLSAAAAQPMAGAGGRLRIVYNGEIYNYRELAAELERDGVRLETASDTEVLLALWQRHGERALERLRGMFAFALWDERDASLTLARDPFGIKPLYLAERAGTLRFASQVKALEAGGAIDLELEPAAVAGFLCWGSVPEPWTIRRGVRALPAGHLVRVAEGVVGAPRAYRSALEPVPGDPAAAFADAVRAHLVADVPVAIFLSAGLDSGAVAAHAVRAVATPPATFTLAFDGWPRGAADEAPLARRVAERLGTRHVERRLDRAEVAAAWPAAIAAMDQPSIDGFNTFLVARAAREAGIRVALSGLGGDELLGSYPSFGDVPRWRRRARHLRALPGARALWPRLARAAGSSRPKLAGAVEHGGSLAGAYFLRRGLFLPAELPALLGRDLAAEALAAHDPVAAAERALAAPPPAAGAGDGDARGDAWRDVQRLECALYLRNQLLRDADWAAMAAGVELRVPFLDVPLWRAHERSGFEPARRGGKRAWARAVAPELPAEIFARPKTGFAVPVAEWMAPAAAGSRDTAGLGARRLALRVLEEWGPCLGR